MHNFINALLWAVAAGVLIEGIKQIITSQDPLAKLLRKWFKSWKMVLRYAALALLVCFLSDFTPIRLGETARVWCIGLPQQEQLVSDAWESYGRGDFQGAIDRSRAIVDLYEFSAKSDQEALVKADTEPWPPGKVGFGRIWKSMSVFENGSLNSVAVAWWIEGRSKQNLGFPCDAKSAYETAARYSYARTWDPQWWPIHGWSPFGWFWSPPDDARERAESIVCPNKPNPCPNSPN